MLSMTRLFSPAALPGLVFAFMLAPPPAPAAEPASARNATSPKPQDDLIAIINGKALTKQDFRTFVNIRTGNRLQDGRLNTDQLRRLLSEYINRELIYQEALEKGYDKVPEVAIVIDNHRRNILASFSAQQIINQPFTEEDLRQAYEKYLSKPTLEYLPRHILVRTEEEAREIIQQLEQGADFEALAKQKSIDASSKDGGRLSWFSPQEMIPPFRAAVLALKPGDYSREPVHTRFGWHIVKLDATREVPPPPFEAARDKARQILQNERLARHIEALRQKSEIQIVQGQQNP